jgi:hypothetical protein
MMAEKSRKHVGKNTVDKYRIVEYIPIVMFFSLWMYFESLFRSLPIFATYFLHVTQRCVDFSKKSRSRLKILDAEVWREAGSIL